MAHQRYEKTVGRVLFVLLIFHLMLASHAGKPIGATGSPVGEDTITMSKEIEQTLPEKTSSSRWGSCPEEDFPRFEERKQVPSDSEGGKKGQAFASKNSESLKNLNKKKKQVEKQVALGSVDRVTTGCSLRWLHRNRNKLKSSRTKAKTPQSSRLLLRDNVA